MSIRSALDDALYATLNVSAVTDLAPGGVWNTTVAQGAAPPYVVFAYESETLRQLFDRREFQVLYRVAAVVPGQWPKAASAIDAVIDGLLDNQPLTVTGFRHLITLRESGVSVPPRPEEGPQYFQVGSRFRIWLDDADD